jgi:hypothetical protein
MWPDVAALLAAPGRGVLMLFNKLIRRKTDIAQKVEWIIVASLKPVLHRAL